MRRPRPAPSTAACRDSQSSRSTSSAVCPPTSTSAPSGAGTSRRPANQRRGPPATGRLDAVPDADLAGRRRPARSRPRTSRRNAVGGHSTYDVERLPGRRRPPPSAVTTAVDGRGASCQEVPRSGLTDDPALGALRQHPVVDAGPNSTRRNGGPEREQPGTMTATTRHRVGASRARDPRPGAVLVDPVAGRPGPRAAQRHPTARRPGGPSTASSAGQQRSARLTIATSTAAMPPKPMERRKTCGNSSSDASATATVSPENATVRPAVAIVRTTASVGAAPGASSSRNRLTTNSA